MGFNSGFKVLNENQQCFNQFSDRHSNQQGQQKHMPDTRTQYVLYCTVLYCTVLYCTVLYCTVLYCTVLYCTVQYCTVLYCTVLYCTVLYCTVLYCTLPRSYTQSIVCPEITRNIYTWSGIYMSNVPHPEVTRSIFCQYICTNITHHTWS